MNSVRKNRRTWIGPVMAVTGLAWMAASAGAATVYVNDGFESNAAGTTPTGWSAAVADDATLSVTDAVAKSGSKSVVFTNGPTVETSGGRYDPQLGKDPTSSITEATNLSYDVRMDTAASVSSSQGFQLGIQNSARYYGFTIILGATGTGGSQQTLYLNGVAQTLGFTLNTNQWLHISAAIDAPSATGQYTVTVSQGAHSQTFAPALINFGGHGSFEWSHLIFGLTVTGTTSSPATVYLDNVLFESAPVPEPATLSLLALGGLLMIRRKR